MSQVLFDSVRQTQSNAIQVQAFLAKVKQDSSLKQQLRAATGAADIAAVARAAGFHVSVADIDGLARSKFVALSDHELDDMAGMNLAGCYQTCARNSTKLT